MSSQNEAHGDEDWMDVSDDAVHEAAIEIICDTQLLGSQLNDSELVAPLADMMCCIDKACHGDPAALNALTRTSGANLFSPGAACASTLIAKSHIVAL